MVRENNMAQKIGIILGMLLAGISLAGVAQTITVPVYRVAPTGRGPSIGSVTLTDTRYGLLIMPDLKNVTPGVHGFHVHQYPSCANNGMAAGGHFDPKKTGKHLGPYNPRGHLGDLPTLTANSNGKITLPVLAPRLKVSEIKGHTLMLHAGGDNYSDSPKKLGGGGARFACGIIQ